MPPRHIPVKSDYASEAIKAAKTSWQYAPMATRRRYIGEWRRHRRLTQAQLAEKLGIDQGHLSKIENGKRQWDEEFLVAAAEVLGCDPADLISRAPSDPAPWWSVMGALTETQRNQVIEMVDVIKRGGRS